MSDLLGSFGLVFLAELGDKSMLLALALATRYRPWPVVAGIAIAAFGMLGLSTLAGAALGAALPEQALAIGGGVLFVAFGLWMLRADDEDDHEVQLRAGSVLLGVTLAFLVAEFGDKTMIAAVTLASTQAPVPTWIGASLGMVVASSLAILVGSVVGSRLPERATRLLAAVAFLLFGAWLLLDAVTG